MHKMPATSKGGKGKLTKGQTATKFIYKHIPKSQRYQKITESMCRNWSSDKNRGN